MRFYTSALFVASAIASPVLQERGNCPRTNLIVNALKASSSASAWCSQYISISTETQTVTKTPPCTTVVVKTTKNGGTQTVTSTAPLAYTTKTVTSTSTASETSTITNTVTDTITQTLTSSSGTVTVTNTCNPDAPRDKMVKRAVATPAALQSYKPSVLSSACSCLSLPCAKATVTKTLQPVTKKVTSTVNVKVSTTVTVKPTSTITKTTTVATTSVTTTSTDVPVTVTATTTTTVPQATDTIEQLSLQIVNSNSTVEGDLAGLNGNGTVIAAPDNSPAVNFIYDLQTGYLIDPRTGFVLSLRYPSYSLVQAGNPNDPQLSALRCAESCGGTLECVVGDSPFEEPVYFYLGSDMSAIVASTNPSLSNLQSLDLVGIAPA